MEDIFLKIVNLSISAGWLVIAIIVLRFLLKKAPRWIVCLLWAMVALRLVLPFSIESALSLIPSTETVPDEFMYPGIPEIHTGVNSLNSVINPIISETLAPTPQNSANPSQILTAICSRIWIFGIIIMALYAVISYIRIRFKVIVSAKAEKGIYITDGINTPFILGIIKPKIYLPSQMSESHSKYVIAHEKAHLRRRDHLWKPLGFALLSVYWFNPLMWVAYILLCRDIELACDEKVVREMGAEDKKAYSFALLSCSVPRRMIAACPLAFGEVGVKARVKSVLSYKKPAFWIIIAAIIASVIIAVCFLTDPVNENIPDTITIIDSGSDLEGISIEMIEADLDGEYPYIEVVWKNKTSKSFTFGDPYNIYRKENGGWKDCRPTEAFWHSIGYMLSPFDSAEKKYNLFHIDMTKEGTYRLEVDCFEDGKADVEYKLWIDFELSEGQPLSTVKQYKATELVYDSIFSSILFTPNMAPLWKLTDISNSLYLQELYDHDADWVGLSDMQETSLRKDNFDNRLDMGASFKEGYSLEKLKKENKRAWQASFSVNDHSFDLYMLLEQKNGDMYMCLGRCGEATDNGLGNATYSYILKLSEMEVGSEQTNADRPMLVYKGKFYVDLSTGEAKLPDNVSYAGVITPEMANNTGLEGMRYFTNEDEDHYFYVEHIADGKTTYKMWTATRTYTEQADAMRYVCKDTTEKVIAPSVVLYPETNRFMFSYSALSSHISMGSYERTNEKLTLREENSDKIYVFDVNGNNLYFDAESSAELPKYKYSASGQPQHPFEDGANFARVYIVPLDEEIKINGIISDTAKADIDGDGKIETLSIGPGPTSGIYTFTITATENGKAEYFNIFTSEFFYTAFVKTDDGKLFLRGEAQLEPSEAHLFEIGVENGNITLTENGEKMGYWGEQGLTSSWFTRYEE